MAAAAAAALQVVGAAAGSKNEEGGSGMGTKGAGGKVIAGGLTAGFGIGQMIAGRRRRKQAEALDPAAEDPEQRMELTRLQTQAKAYETGKAFQSEKEQLQSVLKQQNINAARLSGGAGGAAIAGGSRNASAIGNLLVKLGGHSRELGLKTRTMATDMLNNIAQRKLELNVLKQSRLFAEAAQLSKSGQQNFLAGSTTAISALGASGGDAGDALSGAGEAGEGGAGSEGAGGIELPAGGEGEMTNMFGDGFA